MNSNFDASLKAVLVDEGGNDDDSADSGGRTSRGITQREYNAWCQLHGSPSGDVWKAPDATIAAIYRQQYWLPHCDPLPKGTDFLLFSANVLHGPVQATRFFQQATGVPVDGQWGVVTMAAVMAADPKILIPKVSELKIAFYKTIERSAPKNLKFDKGWINRVNNDAKTALGMI